MNFKDAHADYCERLSGPQFGCTCGLTSTLQRAAGRQAEQQDSNRNAAQRETEALAREEQEFWDRAFLAVVSGALAGRLGLCKEGIDITVQNAVKSDVFAQGAAEFADDLLTARRQRQGEGK